MHVARWTTRTFLLVTVAALAAGCAAPDESVGEDALVNGTEPRLPGPTGCIEEGETGDPDGDISSDEPCPPGNETGTGNETDLP